MPIDKEDARIGARIKQLRLALRLTHRALATLLGVAHEVVENWELGEQVTPNDLERIAEKTNTSIVYLMTGAAPDGVNAPVVSPAARLRRARIDAGFDSASSAARAFGWTISAYLQHENGSQSIGSKAAAKYAAAFMTSPTRLLWGNGASIDPT